MQLVERAACLDFLQTQLKQVSEGEGQCVFLSGEAGIGKTALVKTFCRQQKGSCAIYQGACDALFTPRPLAPLYDVTLQMPEDIWPNNNSTEDRFTFFANFFRALKRHPGVILMVFEDIHWADEATLDFIKFFARRVSHLSCLFILTYRDDEIHAIHPLRNVLGQIPPDSFTRLAVAPLSREAVAKMAQEKGYSGEDVYSISGGNPFYVNEILASYSPGIPDNIKDAILSVYHRQEEGTRNVWQIFSVIPEGLELSRFAKIKAEWDTAFDHCFALQIIVNKNDRIIFKHELYRRTIEDSLTPISRMSINKKILDLLFESFEKEGEIERIVHYAKNADQRNLVIQYAPIAARQAAAVGAHIEASKLFQTAIEYSEGNNNDQLVELYEAYSRECSITGQVAEAIRYGSKALNIWQAKPEIDHTSTCMCFLSRLHWLEGDRDESEKLARQAIDNVADAPSSSAKAMALSNMSQLQFLSEEFAACIEWGNKAVAVAREIKSDELLCNALNDVGTSQCRMGSSEAGRIALSEGLAIALDNGFQEPGAAIYLNISSHYLACGEYALAGDFLNEGIRYCEDKDLDTFCNALQATRARLLLEKGDWDTAASLAQGLLQQGEHLAMIRISCWLVLSAIGIRRGEPEAVPYLEAAKEMAFNTAQHQYMIPVATTCLEYEWLTGKSFLSPEELNACLALVAKVDDIFLNSVFDCWLQRARDLRLYTGVLFEPYKCLDAGEVSLAVDFWQKAGCPFEQAMTLLEGGEEDRKEALLMFQELGAAAVFERVRAEMRADGVRKIPRGLRESTRNNPARLTNRELDVLQLLQEGAQNKEIAGTLYISPKTADHHISNILSKLNVGTRAKAVTKALQLGILK